MRREDRNHQRRFNCRCLPQASGEAGEEMKCKFCDGTIHDWQDLCLHGICHDCISDILTAALADGYTVADGQVWKPCDLTVKDYRGDVSYCKGGRYGEGDCRRCHGTARVKAAGGGT